MLLAEDDGDRASSQANPAFCRMLGYDAALIVGQDHRGRWPMSMTASC